MPASTSRAPVVFLHAHPDDEAIFTGGTLRLLAQAGLPAVVVFATSGEGGLISDSPDRRDLGELRRAECTAAAEVLGTMPPVFLGHPDSGLETPSPAGSFAALPVQRLAAELGQVLQELRASALVTYDPHGIYGHPDHVAVNRVGQLAANLAGVETRYESTVDREYLHFVETHLVEEAHLALDGPDALPGFGDARRSDGSGVPSEGLGLAASRFGTPTVLVDLVVDARHVQEAKRAAMAAHASQIPPTSSALRLDDAAFCEVYGLEWYLRHGPPGPLDQLPRV